MLWTVPVSAETDGDSVKAVLVRDMQTGCETWIEAKIVLDATEMGDLLPMTGTEYLVGAESKAQTEEPHAVDGDPEPDNVQGITWLAALGYDEGGNHTIDKPAEYEKWRAYRPKAWCGNLFSFDIKHIQNGTTIQFPLFGNGSYNLFKYRQIVAPDNFEPGTVTEPATSMNWPQNDYYEATTLDISDELLAQRLASSRNLTLGFIYWLQTEAPRHDGGVGYPGLRLRPDLAGTADGLAKYPYIRESRRIKAQFTVLEQHVSSACRPDQVQAETFKDSVGVGCYRLDLHPSSNESPTIDLGSLPFQIPLGALVPVRMRNLIPACKNLGVTHITNGCYRLHPVEWNIGESAGLLAAYCLSQGVEPQAVTASAQRLADFQKMVVADGVEIDWPKLRAL
jgi:hypothetical protein